MNKKVQFEKFFYLTSIITDYFPKSGARFLDAFFGNLLGNKIISSMIYRNVNKKLNENKVIKKILFVSDLNIGDAIISCCAVSSIKRILPDSEIDFVVKNSTECIIKGNPDISNLYPIFNGAPYPSENDLAALIKIINKKNYDLIINFGPLIPDNLFDKKKLINYLLLASELLKNVHTRDSVSNICYLANSFIEKILSNYLTEDTNIKFKGSKIYLSNIATEKAKNFLLSRGIPLEYPIIMYNPDASARYTRIPFDIQISLLKKLSTFPATILLGAGHVEKAIEYRLLDALSSDFNQNIVIIPSSVPLDVYAALIDLSGIFITGDTGPLHLAAARKYSLETGESLRNKTAVFSIFGGTPPRVYGYDSIKQDFFAANQDAPSRVFIANTPCRNITCINKMAKTCKEVKCFQSLNLNEIISGVADYLNSAKNLKEFDTMHIYKKHNLPLTAKSV